MLPIPSALPFPTTLFGISFASIPALAVVLLIVAFYLIGYIMATMSIARCLPACTPPLKTAIRPTGPTSVMLPAIPGESFARAFMIGITAGLNAIDRKSTRLNSSHLVNSYAVICLKKNSTTSNLAEECCGQFEDWVGRVAARNHQRDRVDVLRCQQHPRAGRAENLAAVDRYAMVAH